MRYSGGRVSLHCTCGRPRKTCIVREVARTHAWNGMAVVADGWSVGDVRTHALTHCGCVRGDRRHAAFEQCARTRTYHSHGGRAGGRAEEGVHAASVDGGWRWQSDGGDPHGGFAMTATPATPGPLTSLQHHIVGTAKKSRENSVHTTWLAHARA